QQRTLVVDQVTGPYAQITQAIAAARPGDRIEVHPPTTFAYDAIAVFFGLDIDAPTGADVQAITISGLAPYHAVRIQGLHVNNNLNFDYRVRITGCAGPVHLDHVHVDGGVSISASAAVALSACALNGTVVAGFTIANSTGLLVTGSNVAVDSSSIFGGQGLSSSDYRVRAGRAAIELSNGTVILTGCSLIGGRGFDSSWLGCSFLPPPGDGGPGITGTGNVVAAGTTSISGGSRGSGACPAVNGIPVEIPVIVRAGPLTVFLPTPPPAAPIPIAEPPSLLLSQLQLGVTGSITVNGVANRVVLIGLDLWNGWQTLPGADLPFLLTPNGILYAWAPPAAGPSIVFPVPIPAVPWLQNQFAHVQAATVDGNGRIDFSNGGYARIR
ncbi:MAG TPA: hypothetical protein VK348_10250, partial [Planctomycetota bacterium]|nr:hypothetical protein [Planctomycetota bacterium]